MKVDQPIAENFGSVLHEHAKAVGAADATELAKGMFAASLAFMRGIYGPRAVAELCDQLAHEYTEETLRHTRNNA